MHTRTVFFVSDGTGITAETFGNAILAQFEIVPRRVRLPFIDTVDKAHQAVRQINHTAELEGRKSIVFTTLVNMEVLKVIQEGCKGMLLDMFGTFVHRVGKWQTHMARLHLELGEDGVAERLGGDAGAVGDEEYGARVHGAPFWKASAHCQ